MIAGEYRPKKGMMESETSTQVANVELYIDGKLSETIKLPMSFITRRHEIAWKYELGNGKHTVKVKLLNPDNGAECFLSNLLTYSRR